MRIRRLWGRNTRAGAPCSLLLLTMKMIHYTLYREDADFVAQCIDYDVSSFGATEAEALANLREAVQLYLEDMPETTVPVITQVTVGELAVA